MVSSVLWPITASGSIFLQRLNGETKDSSTRPASSNISTVLLLGRAVHAEVSARRAHRWVQNTLKSYFIIRLTALSWKIEMFPGLWELVLLHSRHVCPSYIFFSCGNAHKFDHGTWSRDRPGAEIESTLPPSSVPWRRYSQWVVFPLVNWRIF